ASAPSSATSRASTSTRSWTPSSSTSPPTKPAVDGGSGPALSAHPRLPSPQARLPLADLRGGGRVHERRERAPVSRLPEEAHRNRIRPLRAAHVVLERGEGRLPPGPRRRLL